MHRPTFHNAIGGENQGGNFLTGRSTKVGARDLPGQLSIKFRKPQPKPLYEDVEEDSDNIKQEENALAAPLQSIRKLKEKSTVSAVTNQQDLLPVPEVNPFPEDADDGEPDAAARQTGATAGFSSDNSSSDDDDDDDDEAALERELAQVRAEQAAAAARKAAQEQKNAEVERREAALKANPLVMPVERGKRRWCDDSVFKNQAMNRPQPAKRFINDSVRSDFHRRFLAKYIQ